MLNAVAAPEGVDEGAVRKRLLEEHSIEVGAGLGEFKGRAWRIGLMGESATERHVTSVLSGLESILKGSGSKAVEAAKEVYKE